LRRFAEPGATRLSASRKCVPKGKVGIPLDELLAAHGAGNDQLGDLRTRYGADVVPAPTNRPESVDAARLERVAQIIFAEIAVRFAPTPARHAVLRGHNSV
jgi:hypothetical protein